MSEFRIRAWDESKKEWSDDPAVLAAFRKRWRDQRARWWWLRFHTRMRYYTIRNWWRQPGGSSE